MGKLEIRSGRRGRPLSIDPEDELHKLIFQALPKAQARLKTFRESTSGVRDIATLGSETELPKFIEASVDVLQNLRDGDTIDYETLKELKGNLRAVEQLSSKQERVFGRALEETLTKEYNAALDFQARTASDFVKKSNQRVKEMLGNLTPQQRQRAFMSKGYQDPATMVSTQSPSDERVRAWAAKATGNAQITVQEAWAYLRERRWRDEFGFEDEGEFYF